MYGGQNVWRAKCMEGKMYGGQNEWRAKCRRAKCMVGKMNGGQNESGQNVVAPIFVFVYVNVSSNVCFGKRNSIIFARFFFNFAKINK